MKVRKRLLHLRTSLWFPSDLFGFGPIGRFQARGAFGSAEFCAPTHAALPRSIIGWWDASHRRHRAMEQAMSDEPPRTPEHRSGVAGIFGGFMPPADEGTPNVTLTQQKRSQKLDALAKITNSKSFREEINELNESDATVSALAAMLRDDATIKIEDLRKVKRLGEGGFAYVDLYEQAAEGDAPPIKYAVKEMKDKMLLPPLEMYGEPRLVPVPEAERIKFYAEAVLLRQLIHPNVVGCHGCVFEEARSSDGTRPPPKLIQEFCGGGSLLDQLQKPRYSSEQALSWLRETAEGMQYLHAAGGMHRDLKPENVLLTTEGVAKVADFGLFRMDRSEAADRADRARRASVAGIARQLTNAKLASSIMASPTKAKVGSLRRISTFMSRSPERGGTGGTPSPPRRLSSLPTAVWSSVGELEASKKETSTKTGTSRYMAPEVFEAFESGSNYTQKVDVFSFAILCWEMLTRKRAYNDTYMTMDQVARAVRETGLRPKLPDRWDQELSNLLSRAWAQQPGDRPSFQQLAAELGQIRQHAEQRATEKGTTVAKELGLPDASAVGASSCCALM